MTQTTQKEKTLLSPRIPRDTEHERYHPELEEELKECLFCLHRNEMMFDLEVDTDLIEQHIYERQALLAQEVWHSPQPPVTTLLVRSRVAIVLIRSIMKNLSSSK